MVKLSDLRLSKNMKYTALYWSMRFSEVEPDIFIKKFLSQNVMITIKANEQKVYINDVFAFELSSHESFVKLECINRLLTLGYSMSDFKIEEDVIKLKNFDICFITWDDPFILEPLNNRVIYKSRLVSGVLEYQSKIYLDKWYDYGIFEIFNDFNLREKEKKNYDSKDFIIDENRIMKYVGHNRVVVVPEGITELESSSFWDNQDIEEVVLPESLENLGGDTFYYCKNLKKITIPKNVKIMGNNPFAGCPKVVVKNESPYFKMLNGALYTADMETMIYCSILGNETEFDIPEGVRIICKHTFYCCDRFVKITLPKSLEKMENNPFSGCSKLELINNSNSYFIQDDVIYNGFKTSVVGTLNKIKSKRLVLLEGIKTINRNSFWNCKGIETIVFPESLEDIGYNPFVDCSNIEFESRSPYFHVKDGVLYNKDYSKIICYPAWKAKGHVNIPDSVITLERGAFSGCREMTSINLRNVNIINKSCFTNCVNLQNIYCSDLITYIGEWAFAYCSSMKSLSVKKGTTIDNNALSNCGANLIEREYNSNYLIESDNIFTLKSMQKKYKGKIDSILIDPPYNSHIDYIGYKDGAYEEGYLSFMYDRIKLAYALLSDKGFLVINIDEGEVQNLNNLCNTIFDETLVTVHRWKKKHPFFDANRIVLNPNKIQTDYEYIIICRKTNSAIFNKIMQPYIENGVLVEKWSEIPETFDCFGTTSSAKDEIHKLFGRRDYFSTPKPVKLMKELIRATTSNESIVFDFFAGSGTVGQAVNELNNEDYGNRTFILVSNNESNICQDVTAVRLNKNNIHFSFLR